MNTYQHRWLVAQATGGNVETAGGASGSFGEAAQPLALGQSAPAATEPVPTYGEPIKQKPGYVFSLGFGAGALLALGVAYLIVESETR